jgi:cysteine synthase
MSRSLGRLLGLRSLRFWRENESTGGDWLDQAAAMLVNVQSGLSAGTGVAVLAVGSLIRAEALLLVRAHEAERIEQAPLFDGFEASVYRPIKVIVGVMGEQSERVNDRASTVTWSVTVRDACAARRLLAEEEGLSSSVAGAAGFAALVRELQADRQRPMRVRRLPRDLSVVVLIDHSTPDSDDPPLARGAPRAMAVPALALDEVAARTRRAAGCTQA